MRTHAATSTDLNRLLGETDPLMQERILAIGATANEVAEALLELEDERWFDEVVHEPSSARVAEVKSVLQELFDSDDDQAADDEASRN